jgi:NitT/TauT family transport system substrate-binding protein
MHLMQSRRRFLVSTSLAAAAGVFAPRAVLAAGGPPETTTIRLRNQMAICFAPLYVVEAFLHAEGFTDVQWVTSSPDIVAEVKMVERGDVNFGINFAGTIVHQLDGGLQITALGGLHAGCYELFAKEPINSVKDLRGRRVAVDHRSGGQHLYIAIMASNVGLDPNQDIEWVTSSDVSALDRFAAGEADAFLGFPPEPQRLRARGHDRVILNTTLDRPWSQYFCCVMYGNPTWVRDHPVATKRFLRAMYKAADFCTADPAQAAQVLFDGGFAERYDYALETIESIPYDLWHEYDSEDTLRFFGLRLHEAGMLKHSPNDLIAAGTDWRFVNELKRELKT